MEKYDWLPTESAPENYPVEIYSGTFYYGKEGSIYVPNGKTVNRGWGADGSTHIAGESMKEAPDSLNISWISFTEKKNYEGHFVLDTKKIDSLLKHGFQDIHQPGGNRSYDRIKVGMAPGGVVVVWASGVGNQVEVGRYQAKEAQNLDWAGQYPDMKGTILDYADTVIKDLPENVQKQVVSHTIPYGLWDKWRKRFSWKPEFAGFSSIHEVAVDYFNKESENIYHIQSLPFKNSAVIEETNVFWTDKLGREIRTEIKFNEDEAFDLFSKIGDEQAILLITFDVSSSELKVVLKLKDKELPFEKIKTQNFYR